MHIAAGMRKTGFCQLNTKKDCTVLIKLQNTTT